MDVNGDGLVDLVCAYDNNGTLGLKILFSDGSSFAPKDQDRTVVTAAYYSGAQLLPVQFNGDTMCDLLYAFQKGANFEVVLFLSQGWEGFVQQNTNPVPSATTLSAQGILMRLLLDSRVVDLSIREHKPPESNKSVERKLPNSTGGAKGNTPVEFALP